MIQAQDYDLETFYGEAEQIAAHVQDGAAGDD